ncbi:MAG: hypothetical protein DYG98_18535 [Haliscomenobacteraceae bacterium CHB4]|nr:hypothetical protein [Haliscomenobacteraceae bacterium CHB4]
MSLEKNSVIRKIRITASNGKAYNTQFYNLDAIIAVGYRVNSYQATQFRPLLHTAVHPPSTTTFAPVMYAEAAEARNTSAPL